jgi:hypothetical protein
MPHLQMPADFPLAIFDSFGERAEFIDAKYRTAHGGNANPDWCALASATNGITYRWRALSEAQDAFHAAFFKTSTTHDDRYVQESALFTFFTSAVSAVEQSYFAFYAFAALLEPATIDLIQSNPREITPASVTKSFCAQWPSEALTLLLSQTIASQQYKAVLELRNILSHRGVPPRVTAMTFNAALGGGPPPPQAPPTTSWTGRPLDAAMLPSFRADLAALLGCLFTTAVSFANSEIGLRYP